MSEIVVINDDDNVASVCVCFDHSVKSSNCLQATILFFSGHSIDLFRITLPQINTSSQNQLL